MWRAFDDFGNLRYTFVESVVFAQPLYVIRALGGAFFVGGMFLMAYNVYMTIRQAKREQAELDAKLAAKMAQA